MGGHLQKQIAEGAGVAPHAHPRRSAARAPRSAVRRKRRTERRGLRLRLTRQRQREQPTPGSNTTKGAAGGRSDVAKCNEPPSAGRNAQRPPPERPPREAWRDPCEVPIHLTGEAALGTSSARGVTGRSFAPGLGGPRFTRQRNDARKAGRCSISRHQS